MKTELLVTLLLAIIMIVCGYFWYQYVTSPIIKVQTEIINKFEDEANLIIGAEKYYKIINGVMSDTVSIGTKIRIANVLFKEGYDYAEKNLDSTDIEEIKKLFDIK